MKTSTIIGLFLFGGICWLTVMLRCLMLHDCIIEKQKDVMAYGEQYLVHCQCHMGSAWKVWQPGDPEFVCPSEQKDDNGND